MIEFIRRLLHPARYARHAQSARDQAAIMARTLAHRHVAV